MRRAGVLLVACSVWMCADPPHAAEREVQAFIEDLEACRIEAARERVTNTVVRHPADSPISTLIGFWEPQCEDDAPILMALETADVRSGEDGTLVFAEMLIDSTTFDVYFRMEGVGGTWTISSHGSGPPVDSDAESEQLRELLEAVTRAQYDHRREQGLFATSPAVLGIEPSPDGALRIDSEDPSPGGGWSAMASRSGVVCVVTHGNEPLRAPATRHREITCTR